MEVSLVMVAWVVLGQVIFNLMMIRQTLGRFGVRRAMCKICQKRHIVAIFISGMQTAFKKLLASNLPLRPILKLVLPSGNEGLIDDS